MSGWTRITGTEIATADAFFAAYLLATNNPIARVERFKGRTTFVFDVPNGQALQVAYASGAPVSARHMADSYTQIMAIIHSGGGQ